MSAFLIIGALLAVFVLIPMIVTGFLRNVEAGTIRMVSWLSGKTLIFRGPGKSWEVPLLTTGTTLSSKAISSVPLVLHCPWPSASTRDAGRSSASL